MKVKSLLSLVMFSLLAGLVVLSGCQPVSTFYRDRTYHGAEKITLSQGEKKAQVWSASDLNIEYRYQLTGDELNLAGELVLSDQHRGTYNKIVTLDAYLFVLDATSRVLQSTLLSQTSAQNIGPGKPTFEKKITLPPGADSIAFGYRGELRETGQDEISAASISFTRMPQY